jgi:bla regulator protein BlaR1
MIGDLTNHLWQSTWFAVAAGLVAAALRKNGAHIRYWLWFSASMKFLVPFYLLTSLGSHLGWAPAAKKIVTQAISFTMAQVAQPFPDTLSFLPSTPRTADWFPVTILIVWACGFGVIALLRLKDFLYIRAAVRSSALLQIPATLEVRSFPGLLEPGVVGLLRPVLLLPAGIIERLTPPQLEAVLAHELCHVRRRDNLTAALHMIAEGVFWFHPLVWWIGARLVEDRELACDEEVLRHGSEPRVYAEAIFNVCKFYVESPWACMSGVTGSNLKKRMERIMSNHVGQALHGWRKLFLATAGVAALAVPVVMGMLTAPRLLAQSAGVPAWQRAAGGKMSFDVASVKPTQTRGRSTSNVPLIGEVYAPTGGLFSATNTPLMNYMRFAFKDIKLAYQATPDLSGAPGWVRTDQYDIEARAQGNLTKDQMRLMVQSLLADRFKLALHYETRQLPVYALVLSKEGRLGPQLKPSDGSCSSTQDDVNAIKTAPQLPPPALSSASASQIPPIPCGVLMPVPPSASGRMRIAGRKVTLAYLAEMARAPTGADRLVVDHTGLSGTFDMTFEWAPRFNGPAPPGFTPDDAGPTFAESLQEQLGLKLEPQTGPVDVLVIDHVERPSEN